MDTPKDIVTNPEKFAAKFLKILDKNNKLIPFNWNEMQKDFHSKRTGRDIVLKARQIGFSTYIQGEIFRRLITKSTRALTLTHDDKTTQILRETADRFYKHCKFNNIHPARRLANASMSTFTDFDSMHVVGTAGNTDIGRGGSYTDIHLSEVAFFPDAERVIAGAMQGGNPDVILESTANGATGYFYDLCMDALAGRNNWKLHFYPWFSNPEYQIVDNEEITLTSEEKELVEKFNLTASQIKWRRNKQTELKRLFPQEYPESPELAFLMSGKGYFQSLDLSNTFTAPRNTPLIPGHVYSAGIDWGQANDFTVMSVIDRTDNRQVDYLYLRKMSWNLQRLEIIKMYRKWNLSSITAEGNSIGSVNIEELQNSGLVVEKFTTTNQTKNHMMEKFYEALENGLKLIDWGVQRSEIYSIESKQTKTGLWAISAPTGQHDDTVISNCLAIVAKVGKRQARSWE